MRLLLLYNGVSWNPLAVSPSSATDFLGVSCVSTQWCMALGKQTDAQGNSQAIADVYSGGTWTSSTPLSTVPQSPQYFLLTGVSCITSTHCVAEGSWAPTPEAGQLAIETYNAGDWSISSLPIKAAQGNLSCASSYCLVAGSIAIGSGPPSVLSSNDGGNSWTTEAVPAAIVLGPVSCASSSFCMAAGDVPPAHEGNPFDDLFNFNGSSWSPPLLVDTTGNTITAISCPSTQFCIATDNAGNAMMYR